MKIVTNKRADYFVAVFAVLAVCAASIAVAVSLCGKAFLRTSSAAVCNTPTVIIDAGHGGPDGGTSSSDGTLEKDINLEIAVDLNDILQSLGVKTVMIRTDDVSIHDDSAKTIRQKKISDIHNRLKIIEQTPDSVFVSIHQNHYRVEKYYGTQVFYSKNNALSESLAECIQSSVVGFVQPENTRAIKRSGTDIYLLYHAASPAVMVECGFLSNDVELKKLKSNEYRQKIAFAIAIGILDYYNITEEV